MKYVALLRGINVGGNNIIKMIALKECFEKNEFTNVVTYIQSGNVIFESDEKNIKKLTDKLEKMLSSTFNYKARVILKSYKQMKEIIKNVPVEWNKKQDIRCYIGFFSEYISAEEAKQEIKVNEKVDSLTVDPGVVYMTTLMSGLTKSAFNKLIGTKVYQEMTIRNFNTSKKILELMEK